MENIKKYNRKSEKHWNVVAVCCGLAGATIGISVNTSGVFYTPVSENLGILRGIFSMHMTFFTLVLAIGSLFVPRIMKIIPYKVILVVSVSVAAAATAMMGMTRNVTMFYMLGSVRGLFTAMFSVVPISIIINRWFIRKNGLAMSIVFSFSGIVGVFISPFLALIIEKYGWETGYLVKAGILLTLAFPAMIYKFKVSPLEEGLKPYGENIQEEGTVETYKYLKTEETRPHGGLTFISMLMFSIFICFLTGVPQHFPGYSASLGYKESLGAILLSAGMTGNIISKLAVGIMSDRIGAVKATSVLLISNLTGIIILIVLTSFPYLVIGAFLFGSCYGISAVSLSLLTRYFFGMEKYIRLFPVITFVSNVGSAAALSIVGFIYDFSGSYMPGFILSLGIIGISMIFLGISVLEKKKAEVNDG